MLVSRNIRNNDDKFVNRWYINFNLNINKMKKTLLSLGFVLIGTFVFANTNVNEVSVELVVTESNHYEKIEKKIILGACEDAQAAAFRECMSNGCSYWDSYYFGARAWGDCMAELSF